MRGGCGRSDGTVSRGCCRDSVLLGRNSSGHDIGRLEATGDCAWLRLARCRWLSSSATSRRSPGNCSLAPNYPDQPGEAVDRQRRKGKEAGVPVNLLEDSEEHVRDAGAAAGMDAGL